MEVRRFLIGENARRRPAVFGRAKSLESLLDDGRVLAMVVGVHLDVRRTDVHLAAALLSSHTRDNLLGMLYLCRLSRPTRC